MSYTESYIKNKLMKELNASHVVCILYDSSYLRIYSLFRSTVFILTLNFLYKPR